MMYDHLEILDLHTFHAPSTIPTYLNFYERGETLHTIYFWTNSVWATTQRVRFSPSESSVVKKKKRFQNREW